jgi:hypothetical protein
MPTCTILNSPRTRWNNPIIAWCPWHVASINVDIVPAARIRDGKIDCEIIIIIIVRPRRRHATRALKKVFPAAVSLRFRFVLFPLCVQQRGPTSRHISFCVSGLTFVYQCAAHPSANYIYIIESASLLKFMIFRDRASFQGPCADLIYFASVSPRLKSRDGLKAKCTPHRKKFATQYISVICMVSTRWILAL